MHEDCPPDASNVPAAQLAQAVPPEVNWPLEQSWQLLAVDWPAGDALPPGQLKQDDSPVLPWYVPAAQSVQLDTAPADTLP